MSSVGERLSWSNILIVSWDAPLTLAAFTICSKSTPILISPWTMLLRSFSAMGRVMPLQFAMKVSSRCGDLKTLLP